MLTSPNSAPDLRARRFATLFGFGLSGDTIELKTGERVAGAFKQASSAGAVIEVGGQSITIPLEKVQAIYFGVVPGRTGSGQAPSLEPPPIVTKKNYDQIREIGKYWSFGWRYCS